MKTDKPMHGSGKTRFSRGKATGESWVARKYAAQHKQEKRNAREEAHEPEKNT